MLPFTCHCAIFFCIVSSDEIAAVILTRPDCFTEISTSFQFVATNYVTPICNESENLLKFEDVTGKTAYTYWKTLPRVSTDSDCALASNILRNPKTRRYLHALGIQTQTQTQLQMHIHTHIHAHVYFYEITTVLAEMIYDSIHLDDMHRFIYNGLKTTEKWSFNRIFGYP